PNLACVPLAVARAPRRGMALADRDLLDVLDAAPRRTLDLGPGGDRGRRRRARPRSRSAPLAVLVTRHGRGALDLRRVVPRAPAAPLGGLRVWAPLSP